MQKISGLWPIAIAALVLGLAVYAVAPAAGDTTRPDDDAANGTSTAETELPSANTEVCMACHGPVDAWRDLTQDFVSSAGVPVNPHITFDISNPANPHASGDQVMDCMACHQPHPIPLVSPLPEADIQMCVDCHHTGTFRACSECH